MEMEMELNSPRLRAYADLIKKLLNVILSPYSSSWDREEAQRNLDSCLSVGNLNDRCTIGFMLTADSSPHIVHMGFQIIQSLICYKWNEFSPNWRSTIKEVLMDTAQNKLGIKGSVVFTNRFLQESIAKTIAEIAKKEWPQLWPNLVPDLVKWSETSDIPFLIFRRLVEDLLSLGTIESLDRKQELIQTLHSTANDVMTLQFQALKSAVEQYFSGADEFLFHRIRTILSLICAYFAWVNTSVILTGGKIRDVTVLLPIKPFQYQAAECLLQLMERKGTKKESEVISELLSKDCCQNIVSSIEGSTLSEEDTTYLHKLGEVFLIVGSYVSSELYDVEAFGECIIRMASHPDIGTLVATANAYNHYLRNMQRQAQDLNRMSTSRLRDLISIIVKKFSSPVSSATKGDMSQLKQSLSSLLRVAGKCDCEFYLLISNWFRECLSQTPVLAFQLDILAFIADSVASVVSKDNEVVVLQGLRDLVVALERFEVENDSTIKSSQLSMISSLFTFLSLVQENNRFADDHLGLMNRIFSSMFSSFNVDDYTESIRCLRQHVAALMIKLGTRFPNLLTVSFEYIYQLTMSSLNKMRSYEVQSVMESFFVISNTWKNYDRQKLLIETALKVEDWVQMQKLVESPEAFRSFFEKEFFMDNKGIIISNLSMLHAALRRVRVTLVDGEAVRPHPAYDITRQLLPFVFQYVKLVYYLIELQEFKDVLDMTEVEKTQVLGFVQSPGSCTYSQNSSSSTVNAEHIPAPQDASELYPVLVKKFVHNTLENAYGILGTCCTIFTPHFYTIPQIEEAYLNFIGWKLRVLSDYRIRIIMRVVYRPFLLCCPLAQLDSVLKPFLRAFTPFMMERLTQRWNQLQVNSESSDGNEDNEILESSILRLLTREYIEILHRLMEKSSQEKPTQGGFGEDDEMELDDGPEDSHQNEPRRPQNPATGVVKELGELGSCLLKDLTCFQSIIHLCGLALCWDDSGVCYRAGRCLIVCWEHLAPHSEVIVGIFTNCLRSVCVWQENESNMDILIRLIDLIFIKFQKQDQRLRQILLEWGAPDEEICKLLVAGSEGSKNDKKRKDIFRRLVKNNVNLEKNRAPKPSWLVNLPKLVVEKEGKMDAESSTEIDLTECFALAQALAH